MCTLDASFGKWNIITYHVLYMLYSNLEKKLGNRSTLSKRNCSRLMYIHVTYAISVRDKFVFIIFVQHLCWDGMAMDTLQALSIECQQKANWIKTNGEMLTKKRKNKTKYLFGEWIKNKLSLRFDYHARCVRPKIIE